MYVNSKSLTVNTCADKMFDFLSKPENLPKWAINYCSDIRKEDDDYIITSQMGESYFAIEAHKETGIVDMLGGQTKDQMTRFPGRIVALPDGRAHFTLTCIMMKDMSNEEIHGLEQSFKEEFDALRQQLESAS